MGARSRRVPRPPVSPRRPPTPPRGPPAGLPLGMIEGKQCLRLVRGVGTLGGLGGERCGEPAGGLRVCGVVEHLSDRRRNAGWTSMLAHPHPRPPGPTEGPGLVGLDDKGVPFKRLVRRLCVDDPRDATVPAQYHVGMVPVGETTGRYQAVGILGRQRRSHMSGAAEAGPDDVAARQFDGPGRDQIDQGKSAAVGSGLGRGGCFEAGRPSSAEAVVEARYDAVEQGQRVSPRRRSSRAGRPWRRRRRRGVGRVRCVAG
jgi:hypothetical protein